MDELGELAIGLIIVVSLFGIMVPILPGLAMEIVAVFVWAALTGGAVAWSVAIAALLIGGVGTFVKYSIPKRHLNEVGIPNRTLLIATAVAIVGLFVIPVVGLLVFFPLGLFAMEWLRLRDPSAALRSAGVALKAMLIGRGIEFTAALAAAVLWAVANVVWV